MAKRYIVQRQYGEWCVMDAHAHINVTIAVGCPIGQGGTEAGREYAERIAQGLNERNALMAEVKKLRDALIDILDAGDWMWSETDDATIYKIYLAEKDFTEFSDLALAEAAQ